MHSQKNQRRKKQQHVTDITSIPRDRLYTSVGRSAQSPIAPRLITTLDYFETVVNNTLFERDYQFQINSLFDPNLTGTGHQPKGFDQLTALYGRYRVYSVDYKISFVNYAASALPVHCVVVPTNSASGFTTASDAIEAPQSKNGIVSSLNIPVVLVGKVDLAKLNGKSRVAYASDDTTQAAFGASPTELLILHTVVETFDQSTAYQIYTTFHLRFTCEFSDPKELGQS